jgi:uncharacterized RDD family membrane protein YckC
MFKFLINIIITVITLAVIILVFVLEPTNPGISLSIMGFIFLLMCIGSFYHISDFIKNQKEEKIQKDKDKPLDQI